MMAANTINDVRATRMDPICASPQRVSPVLSSPFGTLSRAWLLPDTLEFLAFEASGRARCIAGNPHSNHIVAVSIWFRSPFVGVRPRWSPVSRARIQNHRREGEHCGRNTNLRPGARLRTALVRYPASRKRLSPAPAPITTNMPTRCGQHSDPDCRVIAGWNGFRHGSPINRSGHSTDARRHGCQAATDNVIPTNSPAGRRPTG